ncbi:MAG: transglutaminase domain-containing protein, partial [Phycisphaerales bacterium]|nr:transglutaminase domain-containing protein [Phycisphaerales bacterium]
MTRTILRSVLAVLLVVAPARAATDVWEVFVSEAGAAHGDLGTRAATFLREHRPARDTTIDLDLLMDNLDYALRARKTFPWAADVPEEIFFNDILPYAVLDETRESWRPAFFERASAIVAGCSTASEAAQELNRRFFNEINVHYNTGRKRPNQSPTESIEQGRATCTGLSIILVDACRAVGIPTRVAGVATWHDKRGNHTWVEIW